MARARSLLLDASLPLLLVLPLVALAMWLGAQTKHYPYLNDFWPLLFQAGNLDWANTTSFKNGFFPPGYAVFLWLITDPSILATAYYAGVAFSAGTVLVTYAAGNWAASRAAGMIAGFLTAFYPLNFSLTMITGPDSGVVFMLWLALCLMLLAATDRTRRASALEWAVAPLLFTAVLWRYHALVFAVASVIAIGLVFRHAMWRASAGIVAALGVLAMLSLMPGLSPQLARAQAFGVWEALHPVNWYHMPTDFPPTVIAVIRAEPAAFLNAYWMFHRPYLWLIAIPALGTAVLRGRMRQIAAVILLLECMYVPVAGIGTSPRGIAPIIPASMLCAGLVVAGLLQRIGQESIRRVASWTAVLVISMLASNAWWSANRAFVETSIAGYQWRQAVETELRRQGVTAALQVFGDAGFHFVLQRGPAWYSYLPRSNGGWPRLDLYDLERIAPEIDTSSLDAFVADCAQNGITHVVLSPTAGGLLPDLERVFHRQLAHPALRQTAVVAGFKIFSVTP